MTPRIRSLLLSLGLATLGACGTAASRSTSDQSPESGYFFGWPLFASLGYDIEWIAGLHGSCKTSGIDQAAGVVSLPIDLAVDLVLLPLDVLAGCFGHVKPDEWLRQ